MRKWNSNLEVHKALVVLREILSNSRDIFSLGSNLFFLLLLVAGPVLTYKSPKMAFQETSYIAQRALVNPGC